MLIFVKKSTNVRITIALNGKLHFLMNIDNMFVFCHNVGRAFDMFVDMRRLFL